MNQLKPSWAFLRELRWTVGSIAWVTLCSLVIGAARLSTGDMWGLLYGLAGTLGAVLLGMVWGLAISVEQDEHR